MANIKHNIVYTRFVLPVSDALAAKRFCFLTNIVHFYERGANEIENIEKKNKTKNTATQNNTYKQQQHQQKQQQHIASIFQHKTDLLNESVDEMKRLMAFML